MIEDAFFAVQNTCNCVYIQQNFFSSVSSIRVLLYFKKVLNNTYYKNLLSFFNYNYSLQVYNIFSS
jgi:hypothetical protein